MKHKNKTENVQQKQVWQSLQQVRRQQVRRNLWVFLIPTMSCSIILIGIKEIRALLVELGHEVTEDRLQEIFHKFDVDQSGELCKKEVRLMVDELKGPWGDYVELTTLS